MRELAEFTSEFYAGEIPPNVILKVVAGRPVPTLVKFGQGEDFLFLILKRSSDHKGAFGLLNQREVDSVIGHSFCPVLSINGDATPEKIRTILVPTDISEATTKKLLWASMFAKKTGARIQIVSALNINIDEQKSLARKNAEKIKAMLLERGIESELEILKVHGHVKHEMVLAYMTEKKPDLVIIRKHALSATFQTSIGDFAQEIIHGSKVPVFTVSQSQKDIEQILS
jgi:nucleotide-binding universal stress UspA family protein